MFPIKNELFHQHFMSMAAKDDNNNASENNNEDDDEEDESPLNQLFPKRKKNIVPASRNYFSIPEFLSFGAMLLFIAGVALLASYQSFRKNDSDNVHFNMKQLMDVPENDIYNEMKLPTNVKPLNYVIYLYPNLRFKNMTGVVKITFECLQNSSNIVIHSSKHAVNKIELKNMNGDDVKMIDVVRNEQRGYLILSFNETLVATFKYDLFVGFYRTLDFNPSGGIYLSQYNDLEMRNNIVLSTMFESRQARYAFPCFDEPQLKSTFSIIVRHNASDDYKAISNMPVKKKITVTETDVETHFEKTPLMSTYLVSIMVCNYSFEETKSKYGIPIRIYAPKHRLTEAKFASKLATLALDFYVDKFHLNYTLPKLDLVSVSSLTAAGEESWGAIVFSEEYLLYNENITSSTRIPIIAQTIAHEISHMWFGDLVTPTWWSDLWLKEAFAEYMMSLPLEEYFPQFDSKTSFYSTNFAKSMTIDFGNYSHPIYTDEKDPVILDRNYDKITYEKGAAIVSMLSTALGRADFFNGISHYLKKYEFGNANVNQFWQAMTAVQNNTDIIQMMNQWTVQTGFPLITLKMEEGILYAKQKRFQFVNEASADSNSWYLPLLVRFQNIDDKYRYLLRNSSISYPLSVLQNQAPWYKANYGAGGYYITNYEDGNWNQLLNVFNTDHLTFSAVDRANILSDIAFIENSGHRRINLTLEFTKYLKKERHYIPWKIGIKQLELIESIFSEAKIKKCLRKYILRLISYALDELTLSSNHTFLEKQLINLLLKKAAHYGKNDVVVELQNFFLKYMVTNGEFKLPSDLRSIVLKTGIRNGNSDIWEKLAAMLKTTVSLNDKTMIIKALASTSNTTLLKRMVNITIGIPLLGDDGYMTGLKQVCGNEYGRDIAWTAIKENWDWIYERNKASSTGIKYLLDDCFGFRSNIGLSYFSNARENDVEKLNDLLDNYKTAIFKRSFYQIKEKIKRTLEFRKRKGEVTEWINLNMPSCSG